MSIHECKLFKFNPSQMEKHPKADTLSLFVVPDTNYQCVLKTEEWKNHEGMVGFAEPDTLVDVTTPYFSFLTKDAKFDQQSSPGQTHARVRTRRFCEFHSYGVLFPVDFGQPGDDVFEKLNMGWWEPQNADGLVNGEIESAPPKFASMPKYDIENIKKYGRGAFTEGEPVVATIKYHGQNIAYVYHDGQFYVKSRENFKREFPNPPSPDKDGLIAKHGEELGLEKYNKLMENLVNFKPEQSSWWTVLRQREDIQKFLRDNPDTVLFGEHIGTQGKKFQYGLKGKRDVRIFDIMKDGRWLDYQEARDLAPDLPWVKTAFQEPYDLAKHIAFVEKMPVFENVGSIEEGLILQSKIERYIPRIGRNKLKLINPEYLIKS